jgi:prepilin-type N-terminal cleavage/methylation domain-containing protein
MSRSLNRRAKGFTLPEVLATLAIIAVLAAVVIPTIAGQIQKADPQRLGNDAMALRGGIEQFLADSRRYPSSFGNLTTLITTAQTGLIGGNFSNTEVRRWAGPYIQKDATAALETGWGIQFDPNFKVDTLGVTGLSEATATNPRYLTLCAATDSTRALAVDQMFDDGVLTTGIFRWTANVAGATDTVKFLVLPIQ